MYDRPSGPLSGQRLIAILAVVGLAWFVVSSLQPGPSRISMWGGQNPFAQGKAAGQAAPIAQAGGITGQTVAQAGRGLGGSRKLPLRIGNRAEIVTVILKAESGKV